MKLYAFSNEGKPLTFNVKDIAEIFSCCGETIVTLKDGFDYLCKNPLTKYKDLLPGFDEPEKVQLKGKNVFDSEKFRYGLKKLRI